MMGKMGRTVVWCVLLLATVLLSAPATAVAAPPDTSTWYSGALLYDKSPVDLSAMNHKPAGKYGFVHADGDRLVFANGQEARFWGGNIAAYALFDSNKAHVQTQSKRIAQLGYNLMRLHHMDSTGWVDPTVIDKSLADTQHLSAAGMDRVDYWIKCLRDQGVYIWLDMHVGRILKAGDTIPGFDEISNHGGGPSGYTYFNTRVEELMRIFSVMYLSHVNPYTGLAYKDDPAIIGMELTNEDDLTGNGGNLMLADKNNPYHNAIFNQSVADFCAKTGLPLAQTGQTWLAGPSKIFLNEMEHAWDVRMIDTLTSVGVRVPVATTQMWGSPLFSLPALTVGGIIDVHSYGDVGALKANPRTTGNYVTYIATGQAYGKPLSTTEWNVPFPATDRFTAPLYVASIAALQGWDAPMIYNYSQDGFNSPASQTVWSSYSDAALTGLMPAAAVLFRQGHVHQARQHYCLLMDRQNLYYQSSDISTMATVRTLVERSRISIGLPDIPELTWDSVTRVADGVTTVTNINTDFIPAGQTHVDSDTGELSRDWALGVQTINTSGTQAAHGSLTSQTIVLSQTTIRVTTTPQAAVAVTALDRRPLGRSRRVLVTALARVVGTGTSANRMPMLSEPVTGDVSIAAPAGLQMLPLTGDGTFLVQLSSPYAGGRYTLSLPAARGTHWFLLQDDPALATPGLASSPPVATAAPIAVTFDGATTGTSGLKRIELWYSLDPGGPWTDLTLTTSALAGTFRFQPPAGANGTYHFQLVAVGNNDVHSAAPDGPGDCTTLFDSLAPSVLTVRALASPTTGTQPFDVTFSEPALGFDSPGDVTIVHNLTGTTAHTGVTVAPVTASRYTVTVQGLSGNGTYSFGVNAGACVDQAGWPNAASPPLVVAYPPQRPKPPVPPAQLRLY